MRKTREFKPAVGPNLAWLFDTWDDALKLCKISETHGVSAKTRLLVTFDRACDENMRSRSNG